MPLETFLILHLIKIPLYINITPSHALSQIYNLSILVMVARRGVNDSLTLRVNVLYQFFRPALYGLYEFLMVLL